MFAKLLLRNFATVHICVSSCYAHGVASFYPAVIFTTPHYNISGIIQKIRRLIYYQKVLVFTWEMEDYRKFNQKITVSMRGASLDEIEELYRNPKMDLKVYQWEVLKEKIRSGSWKCIIAKSENKILGYMMHSTNDMSVVGSKTIEFEIPQNACYNFKLFVDPAYRNLSISKQLTVYTMEILNKVGTFTFFSAVNSTNKIHLTNNKKIGKTIIGSIIFFKSFFLNKVFISKRLKKAGLKIKRIYL